MSVESEYILRYDGPDDESDKPRVVLMVHDDETGVDYFTGEQPTDEHIAIMAAGLRQERSDTAFAQTAIRLARSTENYYNNLAEEGMKWLRAEVDAAALEGGQDTMNPDEREVARLLNITPSQDY